MLFRISPRTTLVVTHNGFKRVVPANTNIAVFSFLKNSVGQCFFSAQLATGPWEDDQVGEIILDADLELDRLADMSE